MNARMRVNSLMVELHRFGEAASSLRKGERYLRTMGGDAPVFEFSMELGEEDFLRNLNRLRY
ncbi:MAG TPA: hypothetical protein VML96_13405, partial [Egibacteraceae bacterium]|nr:hypothetical protein [Egibacteraceae bacterium]